MIRARGDRRRDAVLATAWLLALGLVAGCGDGAEDSRRGDEPTHSDVYPALHRALVGGEDERALELAHEIVNGWDALPLAPAARRDSLFELGTTMLMVDAFTDLDGLAPLFDEAVEQEYLVGDADPRARFETLDLAATYHFIASHYDRAAQLQEQAFAALERASDLEVEERAIGRSQLAITYIEVGRYEEAVELLDASLEALAVVAQPDSLGLAEMLGNRGEALRRIGKHERARASYEDALRLLDALRGRADADPETASSLSSAWITQTINLAGSLYDLGELDRALQMYRAADAACRGRPEFNHLLLLSRMNRADVARLQGREDEAQELFDQTLAFADSTGQSRSFQLWSTLAQYGDLRLDMGDPASATEMYGRCEQLLLEYGSAGEAHLAPVLLRRAQALAQLGQIASAREASEEALRLTAAWNGEQSPEYRVCQARLGILLARDLANQDQGAALLAEAIDGLARSGVHRTVRAEARAAHSRLLWARGSSDAALREMRSALEDLEYLRHHVGVDELVRAQYFADYADDFQQLTRWEYSRGEWAAAFQTSERFRARALTETMHLEEITSRSHSDGRDALPAQLRDHEGELAAARSRLRALRRRRARGGEELQAEIAAADAATLTAYRRVLETRAERRRTLWTGLQPQPDSQPPLPLSQIAAEVLRPGEVLLSWQVGESSSFVLSLDAETATLELHELELSEELARHWGLSAGALAEQQLARILMGTEPARPGLVARISDPEASLDGELVRDLEILAKLLLPASLRDRLESARAIVSLPDGPLHLLPLEVLVFDASGPRFGIDVLPPIHYAPSATVLAALVARPRLAPEVGGVLVVANPSYRTSLASAIVPQEAQARGTRSGFSPLPGTVQEAAAIVEVLGKFEPLVLEGRAATEVRLRASIRPAGIVHLATHGESERRGRYTWAYLALTGAEDPPDSLQDGLLTQYELSQLPLAGSMVVLSACESHQGRWIRGEGVFALTRACLSAGATRVVGSLWRADDQSTAWLMSEFYRTLGDQLHEDRPLDLPRQLNEARRALRNRPGWEAPYYWAPFLAVGLP